MTATPRRTVRIDDGLWVAAQAVAAGAGDNISDVIRDKLRDYVNESETE